MLAARPRRHAPICRSARVICTAALFNSAAEMNEPITAKMPPMAHMHSP